MILHLLKREEQAVMSFHQCGGNVGDSVSFPLPARFGPCFQGYQAKRLWLKDLDELAFRDWGVSPEASRL